MHDATGSLFSDGMLFTQLSKPLFDSYYDDISPEAGESWVGEIEQHIAEDLFAYLKGKKLLYHPGIHREIVVAQPMTVYELAVCVQNKRYERRGAEYETFLFVRGTPDGSRGDPKKDPLYNLKISERIQFIALLQNTKVYYELRNITRHRAHEAALRLYAQDLLHQKAYQQSRFTRDAKEVKLLEEIIKFLNLDDLKAGQEINLYKVVGQFLQMQ